MEWLSSICGLTTNLGTPLDDRMTAAILNELKEFAKGTSASPSPQLQRQTLLMLRDTFSVRMAKVKSMMGDREAVGSARIDETGCNHQLLELTKLHTACVQLLQPVRRVPAEVLIEIFCFAIPGPGHPNLDTNQAPLNLSQVCTMWRRIALGVPQLWRYISIGVNGIRHPFKSERHLSTLIHKWVMRAGDMPLSFRLRATEVRDWEQSEFAYAVNNVLTFYAERFVSLDLNAPWILPRTFERFPAGHFQRLETLIFHFYEGLHNDGTIIAFQSIPLLRRVALQASYHDSIKIQFPYRQLTHLTLLNYLTYREWDTIMSSCDSLLCSIARLRRYRGDLYPRKYTLPFLQSLALLFNGPVNPAVLCNLEAPQLRSLRLGTTLPNEPDQWMNTPEGFTRILSSLTHLTLSNSWPLSGWQLRALLFFTPQLLRLDLGVRMPRKSLFGALHLTTESSPTPCFRYSRSWCCILTPTTEATESPPRNTWTRCCRRGYASIPSSVSPSIGTKFNPGQFQIILGST
ncbi:hypothetical protein BD779DRAFT_1211723 [Infundibulicybe gibba]|nr:hypothetical protein BD779DRAFT_1211723 [Infundibulicybe gibba]